MDSGRTKSLASEVFTTITSRLRGKAEDIYRFAQTQYSFEEWLNWEAFAACASKSQWAVAPKPSYASLGIEKSKDFGDLLVSFENAKVLVEVGLVHDGTGDKWRTKLAWDVEKLARQLNGIASLQIIVLVSTDDISKSEFWQRWLSKVECWNRSTDLEIASVLLPSGTMLVRGWVANKQVSRP